MALPFMGATTRITDISSSVSIAKDTNFSLPRFSPSRFSPVIAPVVDGCRDALHLFSLMQNALRCLIIDDTRRYMICHFWENSWLWRRQAHRWLIIEFIYSRHAASFTDWYIDIFRLLPLYGLRESCYVSGFSRAWASTWHSRELAKPFRLMSITGYLPNFTAFSTIYGIDNNHIMLTLSHLEETYCHTASCNWTPPFWPLCRHYSGFIIYRRGRHRHAHAFAWFRFLRVGILMGAFAGRYRHIDRGMRARASWYLIITSYWPSTHEMAGFTAALLGFTAASLLIFQDVRAIESQLPKPLTISNASPAGEVRYYYFTSFEQRFRN